jgi:chlorobactene glucosyltransferase
VSVAATIRLVRHRWSAKDLEDAELRGLVIPSPCPFVSILIPARNEEEILERCVSSALAQDYPNFEVVVCDDDSTDATPRILERLARNDSRLRVVTRRGPPPAGWVGKNFALASASRAASGEWFLGVDADCVLSAGALRAAILRAELPKDGVRRSLVSALPFVECPDFANRLMMPTFGYWLSLAMPLHRVNDPARREAIAAGGFLLVRREAMAAIGGYERLAPHIVEDGLTARLVKASGRRIEVFLARDSVTTRMYDGWRDLWEGLTKNAFAAADFRAPVAAALILCILGFAVLPAVAAVVGLALALTRGLAEGEPMALGLLAFAAVNLVAVHAAIAAELRIPRITALAAPLGHLIFAAALASSTLRAAYGRGVAWKGRHYYGAGRDIPSDKLLT